ncbi:hypothetical protein [Luteolibacter sp. LG18]|uniref:hypothetical protein n=1 Tax=Luteolibacter sp. LG18 TaxID=2819286 RepID=UPI002B281D49|nr:hypothetical protein llg_20470 [Luteolibacter sp. LG18]
MSLANLRLPAHWSGREKAFVLFIRELVMLSWETRSLHDDGGRASYIRRFLLGLRVHLGSWEECIEGREFFEETGLLEWISREGVLDCFEIGEAGVRVSRRGLRKSVRRAADDLAALVIPVFVHGTPMNRFGFQWRRLVTRWRDFGERRRAQRLRRLLEE